MATDERRPTLLSVQRELRRQAHLAKRATARSSSRTFTGISVTGVTTTTAKSVFTNPVEFMLDDAGMVEVYAAFQGTIGAGQTLDLNMVVDGGADLRILRWTGSVTNQTRYSTPETLDGTTATRGGFQVRSQDLAAGFHTLQFRFTVSGGTGSASSGVLSFRFS